MNEINFAAKIITGKTSSNLVVTIRQLNGGYFEIAIGDKVVQVSAAVWYSAIAAA